jgi:homocitrate synthase
MDESANRSRIRRFKIIDSTLREGEQFVGANFTTEQKVEIARALDEFGVEYIELTSPTVSPKSYQDLKTVADLGLKAKILTHTRCHRMDAAKALEVGNLGGIDIVIGTSSLLRRFSHGKEMPEIIETAVEVISFIKKERPEIEVRFSTEDSFRSVREDLFLIYQVVDELGINRVGIADTVGVATPFEVYEITLELKKRVRAEIEFHGHNDSGCAIANSYAALEGGATCVDINPELVRKYSLKALKGLDEMVAQMVGVSIPFSNYITGITAFTHKAGIHAKAILNQPSTYEILDPEEFGLSRYISIAHRLTGWNAIKWRAKQLGLELNQTQIKRVTTHIKALADEKPLCLDDVDTILRCWADGQDPGRK